MRDWLALAFQRSVRERAIKVAIVVGTILGAINHWHAVITGEFTPAIWTQIALTYVVPYCVSTYASVQAIRHLAMRGDFDR